jgi:hypothetical protein
LGTITQLYPTIELYSDGEPPQHTIFVLGKGLPAPLGAGDELLLVDPPDDAPTRFSLPERTAALFTGTPTEASIALLQTQSGGVAHVRIGDHYLDIYAQQGSTVVHIPAVGILCGGTFGSNQVPPRVAPGSDGQEELDALRLLARLVRDRRVQLYIPRQGALVHDRTQMMERLADDVAYIHGLRRVIPMLAKDGQGLNAGLAMADTLLPAGRHSPASRAVNAANIQTVFLASTHAQN